jgi:uncharacterized protein
MKTYILVSTMLLAGSLGWAQVRPPVNTFSERLVAAALERTQHEVIYDGAYHGIAYPGGDVPKGIGVCTDVVIRAYRTLGHDLQKLVHEDMKANFSLYPKKWGLKKTDTNIDHRRVPNLRRFFERQGQTLPITQKAKDYRAGDLVTWRVGGKLPHIGILVASPQKCGERPWVVHNIGRGPMAEDILFEFPITGHYRFEPPKKEVGPN